MSKVRKGYDAQDAALARFKRDARGTNANSAVVQCMKGAEERKAYRAKMANKSQVVFAGSYIPDMYRHNS
jgi:hypothetical protein|tara:strand:- start:268 stop:477 length:210 start_codon:yes stop_codon:yes gene_type:complete